MLFCRFYLQMSLHGSNSFFLKGIKVGSLREASLMPAFHSPPKLARGLVTAMPGHHCPGPALRAGRMLVGKEKGQTGICPHHHWLCDQLLVHPVKAFFPHLQKGYVITSEKVVRELVTRKHTVPVAWRAWFAVPCSTLHTLK